MTDQSHSVDRNAEQRQQVIQRRSRYFRIHCPHNENFAYISPIIRPNRLNVVHPQRFPERSFVCPRVNADFILYGDDAAGCK